MEYYPIDYDKMFIDHFIDHFQSRVSIDQLERLHYPLEQEIRGVCNYIESLADVEYPFGDRDVGDEDDQVESFLGIAFVVAQVYLTTVRTSILSLSESLQEPLAFIGDNQAYSIFRYENPTEPKSRQPYIRLLNEVANYWKHHDEWVVRYPSVQFEEEAEVMTPHWDNSKVSEKQRKTIEIVTSIGMRPNELNMHLAASALGISKLWDLSPLRNALEDWVRCLLIKFETYPKRSR